MGKANFQQPRVLSAPEVDEFERLQAQMEGLHTEIQTLVRKSPNDLLNKFKLGLINAVLLRANALLRDRYRPFADFADFADAQAPSNSDVMLVLSQYLAAMESMRADHIHQKIGGTWVWMIDGQESQVKTRPPLKLDRK